MKFRGQVEDQSEPLLFIHHVLLLWEKSKSPKLIQTQQRLNTEGPVVNGERTHDHLAIVLFFFVVVCLFFEKSNCAPTSYTMGL